MARASGCGPDGCGFESRRPPMRKIVLASASPRRKKLLEQIGLQFEVCVSNFDETEDPNLTPHELAKNLSLGKAKAVALRYKDAIVISADTFVSFKGAILSKPETKENAKLMLRLLSGRVHPIITGFTVLDTKTGKVVTRSVETKVYMKKLTDKEIGEYIETGEPLDKAGAYGIQERGVIFVEKIEGDYSNVVGLPLYELVRELNKFGVKVMQ